MSNKTFNMSTDRVEPHRDLQLCLSSESHYSNSSLSLSPDSNSSVSIPSDREANSSPDVKMLEDCLKDGSPVDNLHTALPQSNLLCCVSTNLNQTFIATPVNGSVNFWNAHLTPMCHHQVGSEKYQTFNKNTENGNDSAVMSADPAGRKSQVGSCKTSHRGSTENDCCSPSSGEMVIRSNSFCLDNQSPLIVSSLEESSISLAAGNLGLPGQSNILSTPPLDIGEKSSERVLEENTGHPCLGLTFTQAELTTEKNVATSNSLVALPNENEGVLLMTFVCETSPADCGKEAQFANKGQLFFPEALTPEQGKICMSALSAAQDTDKYGHTSTPIQNIGSKMPTLPSFLESPCTGNAVGQGLHSVKNSQSVVAGLQPSAGKVKKMEIKKFPKSDFSKVKSKIVTRNVHQMSAPGTSAQHKPSQVDVNNKHPEAHRGATMRISPAKMRSSNTVVSATSKMVDGAQRQGNPGAVDLASTIMTQSKHPAMGGQGKSGAHPPSRHPTTNNHTSAIQCRKATSETKHRASSQVANVATQLTGNQTFCLSSFEKCPDRSGQMDSKPPPKKCMSNKIEVRTGSALGQDKPHVLKTRPRCSSESSLSSWPPKEKKTTTRFSTNFTLPKADTHLCPTKQGGLKNSSQNKREIQAEANSFAENSIREVKKISLVTESGKSAKAGASWDESKSRLQERPSPRRTREALLSQAQAARPRPATLPTRQRQPALGRDEYRISKTVGTPQFKQKSSSGTQRTQVKGGPSLENASIKPQLHGSRPLQTPTRASFMDLPPTTASRPSRKTLSTAHSELNEGAGTTQVSGGSAHKPTPLKTVVLKARLFTTPVKMTGQSLAPACKSAPTVGKGASNSTVSPLKRTSSGRFVGLTSSGHVDKNKTKASSHQQPPQHQAIQSSQGSGPPDVVPASATEVGRKDETIQQLKGLLAASYCKFEAVAIVLQQTLAERDEATRHCRDLSQELVNLRGELVCSVHSSERLEKEKEELRVALEDALQKLQEQHQRDLAELELRLQAFYQAEWDRVHLTYQEETNKCKSLMQQQMGELEANHDIMKQELETSHTEELQCVKQQYEVSLEELTKVHNEELQSLDKALKDTEATLSGQIGVLTMQNKALIEKLAAEENRRRELAERSQKDSHTLYLEQELESLKVVLDIKNKQLHQQETKLMELDKLKDKNVRLDESLQKVQQENEDLKARMDRHAALSRQLSTEQAALQESLQKESKVNKRLSMENEELLWKLNNGDLSSPRRVSPASSSPSHSFTLQSPRNSGQFSSPPVSPR